MHLFEMSALEPCQNAFREDGIWVEGAGSHEIDRKLKWMGKPVFPERFRTPLVFEYREGQDSQAWERLESSRHWEVILVGQFETTDWPMGGGFGHLDAYSHELILADVLVPDS